MAADGFSLQRMVPPPDGRQTRISFAREQGERKHRIDWWLGLSSFFRNNERKIDQRLVFFAQQLENEGYSSSTRETYILMIKRFFAYLENPDPGAVSMADIEDYNYAFFVSGRYSRSYQLQFVSAIRQYFRLTEGISINLKGLRKTGLRRHA
ncbi:MAG: hypothetical protein CSA96_06425 [Bacteroidetes bacterium]|nr:MAG: hypothetical protein CSA96_06425 [Bacteroidota bacterium]